MYSFERLDVVPMSLSVIHREDSQSSDDDARGMNLLNGRSFSMIQILING